MQFKDEDPLVALRAALSVIDTQLYLSETTVRELTSLHEDMTRVNSLDEHLGRVALNKAKDKRASRLKSLLLMKASEHMVMAERVATLRRVVAALHDKNQPP